MKSALSGLYGLNGRKGTDEGVWGDVTDRDERMAMVETAVMRWQSEGHTRWNNRLFRAILVSVVSDNGGSW